MDLAGNFTVYHVATFISLIFLFIILDMVRRGRLLEQYSLLWIFVSLIMILISVRHEFLEEMARLMRVDYAPSVLFLAGMIFSFALILHFSLIISRYKSEHVRVVQELGILKERVASLERKIDKKINKSGDEPSRHA